MLTCFLEYKTIVTSQPRKYFSRKAININRRYVHVCVCVLRVYAHFILHSTIQPDLHQSSLFSSGQWRINGCLLFSKFFFVVPLDPKRHI